jgi:hypothetical protein
VNDAEIERIVADLVGLCRGRGLMESDAKIGSHLAAAIGMASDVDKPTLLAAVTEALSVALGTLPDDLRLVAMVAMGLDPDVRSETLEGRRAWTANHFHYAPRTAHRRALQAFELVAAELVRTRTEENEKSGWYLASLRVLLRMDLATPETLEERVVVSTVDGLVSMTNLVGIPRPGGGRPGLHTEVIFGAELVDQLQPSASVFRRHVKLPRPLRRGESHEYYTRTTVPDGEPMVPRYIYEPTRRNELFTLRIRFHPARLPAKLWLLDGTYRRAAEDPPSEALTALELDRLHEVCAIFRKPRLGLAYGIRWEP